MKRKITIAVAIFFLFFFLSGIYAISAKEKACAKLDNLVRLHRIEILRGHLLIHLKWVQSDLQLRNTRFARSRDTITEHVRVLESIVPSCFSCHHSQPVTEMIVRLRDKIGEYRDALHAVLSTPLTSARFRSQEDQAFATGARLIAELDELTTLTSRKLNERTDRAFQEISRTNTMLYVLMGIVPVVAIVFAVAFVRGFTRPVNELLTATRRLKAGDLGYRIGRLSDEYGEVASSFNEMAASLKAHFERMQWAEQLVVMGELAGGLAHEIKNPLAGMQTSIDYFLDDTDLSDENRTVARRMSDQVRRIEQLMKSLLNYAKPPKPSPVPVDMNQAIDSAIGLALKHPLFRRPRGEEISVSRSFEQGLPATFADPVQLQQIFVNLMLNSADAMPNGGSLSVRTEATKDREYVLAHISDTGEGIGPDVGEKIFNPFFTTKAQGTGLGLSISRRLIEQQGGGICAKNAPQGGAVFTITLPAAGAKNGAVS